MARFGLPVRSWSDRGAHQSEHPTSDWAKGCVASLTLVCAATVAAAAPGPSDGLPYGIWFDHTGRGAVEIRPCGTSLCGYVVWLQDKKHTEQCNRQIIGGVTQNAPNRWSNGWILDPDRNRKFDLQITVTGTDTVEVLGYLGNTMFGQKMMWRRAPSDLQKCGTVQPEKTQEAAKSPEGKPNAAPPVPPADKLVAAADPISPEPASPTPAAHEEPAPGKPASHAMPIVSDKKHATTSTRVSRTRVVSSVSYGDFSFRRKANRSGRKECHVSYASFNVAFPCPD